jgi:predicted ATP-grasp superfamily ATP-dependent carboligase
MDMSRRGEARRVARPRRVFVCEYLSAGGAARDADASLLAQGSAMRDALVADLLGVPGVSVTLAHGAGVAPPAACGAAQIAVALGGEALFAFVRGAARSHDVTWVVAPESDGLLARLHDSVAASGASRWVGCDAASIAIASSKRATLEWLARYGIATPLAFTDGAAAHWVVKPDDGAGAAGTHCHASRDAARADLQRRHAAGASATLEPWVEGEALSMSLLCGGGKAELLAANRQRIALGAEGHVEFGGVEVHALRHDRPRLAALHALAGAVARALPGLAGYVGVDLVWHAARGPVVIEINPRLTCAYVGLSAALGRNVAHEVVAGHESRLAIAEAADARA